MRVKILLLPLVFHLVTQKKISKKKIKKQDCILVCERNAKKKLSHLSHIISTMHIKITAMTILYQNNNKKIKCEKKYIENRSKMSHMNFHEKKYVNCKLRLFEQFSNSVLLVNYSKHSNSW